MKTRLQWLGLAIVPAMVATNAEAVPRYALQYDQGCVLCHNNPTGGGQRSTFGAQFFAYSDLAIKRLAFDELEAVQPQITDQLQVGFDARTIYAVADEPESNTFFEMQGDLYLNFQLDDQWKLLLDKGLYDNFELMAIGHILSANGYVKIGHFAPPFGLRQPNHNAFVRERMGVGTDFRETGMEIGFHPERINAAIAVTNGTSSPIDNDRRKAVTARVDVRRRIGSISTWLGATGRLNDGPDAADDRAVGGYGGVRLGAVSLIGEVTYREVDVNQFASYAELAVVATQGVTVRAVHEFHDADVDLVTGAENRYGFGVEVVPTGFLQLVIEGTVSDPSSSTTAARTEGVAMLHLFY